MEDHRDFPGNADLVALIVNAPAADPPAQVEKTREILQDKKIATVRNVPEEPGNVSIAFIGSILFCNKIDSNPDVEILNFLMEMYGEEMEIHPLSVYHKDRLNEFAKALFSGLKIVRVFSKPPGKPVDKNEPFILPQNSTLFDLAVSVHCEFASHLCYARV